MSKENFVPKFEDFVKSDKTNERKNRNNKKSLSERRNRRSRRRLSERRNNKNTNRISERKEKEEGGERRNRRSRRRLSERRNNKNTNRNNRLSEREERGERRNRRSRRRLSEKKRPTRNRHTRRLNNQTSHSTLSERKNKINEASSDVVMAEDGSETDEAITQALTNLMSKLKDDPDMLDYERENDDTPVEMKIPDQTFKSKDEEGNKYEFTVNSKIIVDEPGNEESFRSTTFEFTVEGENITIPIEDPADSKSDEAKNNVKVLGKKTVVGFIEEIGANAAKEAEK